MSTHRSVLLQNPTPDAPDRIGTQAAGVELRGHSRASVPRVRWSPQLALLLAAVSVLSALITLSLLTLVGGR
jgi:hypothetical protein